MVECLSERANNCAEQLQKATSVLLVSHNDADGLASAGIAATALKRANIDVTTIFEKQLDEDVLKHVATHDEDTVLFTDFGSGQLKQINEHASDGAFTPIIVDHHQPANTDTEFHLNPLLENVNGASELSGAGATYILARALETSAEGETDNRDLAALGVVGAIGDRQLRDGELIGANQQMVAEGVEVGVLHEQTNISFYGKQTRPLPKLLEYADGVHIPGLTGNKRQIKNFLSTVDDELNLDLRKGGEWQRWVDLERSAQRKLMSKIMKHAVKRGVSVDTIDSLVATSYLLPDESKGTELRDASEFSTLLNSTARYGQAQIGFAVCCGERGIELTHARELRANHKQNLSEALALVKREGVTTEENIQWFDAGDRIRDTIVGIVAGMALGKDSIDLNRPIIAFATRQETDTTSSNTDETPERKVSARGTNQLVQQGLNLAGVMNKAAGAVGGGGGGHDIAAGASIPSGAEKTFIKYADEIVDEQLQ